MILRKGTTYALYAAIEMARSAGDAPVTSAQTAERYGVPGAVMAKVFQRLVGIGIATGTRGTGGGYQLARPPAEVTLLEVVDAFQPPPEPAPSAGGPSGRGDRGLADRELRRILAEVDEVTRSTLASITLETLVGPRGLRAMEEKP